VNHSPQSLPPGDTSRTTRDWSAPAKLAYRFIASYFALYFVPAILFRPLDVLVASWLGVSMALMNPGPSGSGDKMADWVHALTVLTLSLAATVVWSVLDRNRREYTMALSWTRLGLRYVLAWILIGYGLAKVFPMQFQPPVEALLLQRFGDFSPMGLLWSFMGASMGYTIFAGALEVIGALLLLFRRTSLVGALFTSAVMANVFALNMFYDVPVKLYSFHLLVMAVVIAAPDLGRLFRFAVLQKATDPPSPAGPVFAKRGWRVASWAGKAIALALLIAQAGSVYSLYNARVLQRPTAGTYRVEGFPDWQQVELEENVVSLRVTRDNGTITRYRLKPNDDHSGFQLRDSAGREAGSLAFHVSAGKATLEGNIHGERTRLHLVRAAESFLLLDRGFHWTNEVPFNR
jgi:hypothetical protein